MKLTLDDTLALSIIIIIHANIRQVHSCTQFATKHANSTIIHRSRNLTFLFFLIPKQKKKQKESIKKNEKPARKVCKEKVINSTKEMQNDVF